MNKKTASKLVLLSSLIILILGVLNIIAWITLYYFLKSIDTAPPTFLLPFLNAFLDLTKHPGLIISTFLTLIIGIVLLIASRKMRWPEKLANWSVVSLVTGLIIIFELKGGILGGITAGILSSTGGIFGLIEASKKQ